MSKNIKVKFVRRVTHVTRDLTIGKEYEATRLTHGSYEADGDYVGRKDGVSLVDDVGDVVYTAISLGFELVE